MTRTYLHLKKCEQKCNTTLLSLLKIGLRTLYAFNMENIIQVYYFSWLNTNLLDLTTKVADVASAKIIASHSLIMRTF